MTEKKVTKGVRRMKGKADCAELPGRLLEGLKTSKTRAFDLTRPSSPLQAKGAGGLCKRFAQSAGPGSDKA